METTVKTKDGTWRAQVRRKGKYASQSFRLKTLADEGIVETERLIDIVQIAPLNRSQLITSRKNVHGKGQVQSRWLSSSHISEHF